MSEFRPNGTSAPAGFYKDVEETWRFGKPYLHEPSQGMQPASSDFQADDHWKTVADHLTAVNQARCRAWKDEVKNLLVFSGLFSAVVTGLLVNSSQSLQQDRTQILLSHIASQSNTSSIPIPPFAPTRADERINVLWYMSLVFSLATALVGIVAQQWLREHLRPSTHNTPLRFLPALLHMQSEALDKFWVDHIFTALPLLLILGLILFLIGLIDFLVQLNDTVAKCVTPFIGAVFAFLLITTLYPAFQPLPYHPTTRKNPAPSAPCSYRSPQSWLFLRLSMFLQTLWRPHRPVDTGNTTDLPIDWIKHGLLWLRQRDIDFLSANPTAFDNASVRHSAAINPKKLTEALCRPETKLSPIYDSVKSLLKIKEDFASSRNRKMTEVFQCFHDLTSFSYEQDAVYVFDLATYINHLIPTAHERPLPLIHINGPTSDNLDVVVTNARLLFFDYPSPDPDSRFRFVTLHHLEMFIRLAGLLADRGTLPSAISDQAVSPLNHFPDRIFVEKLLDGNLDGTSNLCSDVYSCVADRSSIDEFHLRVYRQMFDILETFFDNVSVPPSTEGSARPDPFVSVYSHYFLATAARALSPASNLSKIRRLDHDRILNNITKRLKGTEEQLNGFNSDLLFFTAALYVHNLLQLNPPHSYHPTRAIVILILTLRAYKHQHPLRVPRFKELQSRIIPQSPLFEGWTLDFLDFDFSILLSNGTTNWKRRVLRDLFPPKPGAPTSPELPDTLQGLPLSGGLTMMTFPYPFIYDEHGAYLIRQFYHKSGETYFNDTYIGDFIHLVMMPPEVAETGAAASIANVEPATGPVGAVASASVAGAVGAPVVPPIQTSSGPASAMASSSVAGTTGGGIPSVQPVMAAAETVHGPIARTVGAGAPMVQPVHPTPGPETAVVASNQDAVEESTAIQPSVAATGVVKNPVAKAVDVGSQAIQPAEAPAGPLEMAQLGDPAVVASNPVAGIAENPPVVPHVATFPGTVVDVDNPMKGAAEESIPMMQPVSTVTGTVGNSGAGALEEGTLVVQDVETPAEPVGTAQVGAHAVGVVQEEASAGSYN